MEKSLMGHRAVTVLFAVCAALLVAGAVKLFPKVERIQQYNCDIAEFSPDAPTKVKEMCREARMIQSKKEAK